MKTHKKRDYLFCIAYVLVCLALGSAFAICNQEKPLIYSIVALSGAIGVLIGTHLRYNSPELKKYVLLFAISFTIVFIIGGILNMITLKSWMLQLAVVFISVIIALVLSLVKYIQNNKDSI